MQGFFNFTEAAYKDARRFLSTYAQFTRDVMFPKECIGCGADDTLLCARCAEGIIRSQPTSALVCSACVYDGVVRDMLIRIKMQKEHRYIPILGDLLCERIIGDPVLRAYAATATIAYVPMHWMKLNMRGFNQSELLARHVATCLGQKLPFRPLLRRGRLGLRQSSLTREGRIANVNGMFLASPQAMGKRILLIDDIRTSGATLMSATKALIAAGAAEVRCLTVAQGQTETHN